jgi:uncharacterized protein (DUF305 family)
MENKNNNVLVFSILFLIMGLFGGWLIWGNRSYTSNMYGAHMMPNGQMMSNNGIGGMSAMMDEMMNGLYGKTEDTFDRAFLQEMIVHHEGAVLMAQLALKNAKHQEIKNLATGIISAQNSEIASMKGWLKTWYNIGY